MENKKVFIKLNILAIVCIIIFGCVLAQKQLQNDTFYTIKLGEHIIETNGVDMKDSFSWHKDLTYTYPHWLYDVGIYLIYNFGYNINAESGGMFAIYLSTCLFSVVLGILLYFTNVKINKNHVISFIITLLTMFLLRNFLAARAQLVSFSLFILEIYFIEKFLETKKLRYGIGLFIIATLIANIHAAVWYMFFVLTLPYFVEYLMVVIIKKSNKMEEKFHKIKLIKRDNVKWLAIVIIVCVFSGLLTPQNTFEPYTHIVKLMKGNTMDSISEHKPIVLINTIDILMYLVVIIGILIFSKTKITFKDLFMLGGLILLTLISGRQKSMLVLIGIYSIIELINETIAENPNFTDYKVTELCSRIYSEMIIIMLTFSLALLLYGSKNKDEYINKELYPVRACNYILKNMDVSKIRIYNDYNYGSYLMYKNIPVFIDSRCDLYTPEFNKKDIFKDAHDISGLSTDYEEKFSEYGITHILIKSNSLLRFVLSKDNKYKCIYIDDDFCIYERARNQV